MPTDIRKIKSLIELVEKSSITTLEISEDGETIKISRATDASTAPAPIVIPMMTGGGYYPAQNQAPQYQSSGSAASRRKHPLHLPPLHLSPHKQPLKKHQSPALRPLLRVIP